jgi:hypothetical protein
MRNDDLNRDLNRRDNMGGMILGALAVLAVLGALFMWAPWRATMLALPIPVPALPSARRPALQRRPYRVSRKGVRSRPNSGCGCHGPASIELRCC